MESQIIYFREIGKQLKLVTSPVLRKIRKQQRMKSRNIFTQPSMLNYWSECVKKDEKQNEVKSLFDSVLDFLAANSELIDSLEGIPELIGENIFERYLQHHFINHLIPTCETMEKFTKIYGENILQNLQLTNNSLTINEFLNLFQILLPNLTKLDLSHCLLGDEHEIIQQIQHLNCLEYLNVSNNALSDKTMRRMTISYPKSPIKLKFVDLSANSKITNRGIEKLICFDQLQFINVSGLNIDLNEICEKFKMKICDEKMNFSIETSGWCRPLVIGLIKAVNSTEIEIKDQRIINFYGNRPKVRLNLFADVNPNPKTVILIRDNHFTTRNSLKRKKETKNEFKKVKLNDHFDLMEFYK